MFEDLVVPIAVGAVAGIVVAAVGATTATAMAVGTVAGGLLAASDSKLWDKIKKCKYLTSFRKKVTDWYKEHENDKSFHIKVIRFFIGKIDGLWVLIATAIDKDGKTKNIGHRSLSPKEMAEMGIKEDTEEDIDADTLMT
jgi:hypothetical protein